MIKKVLIVDDSSFMRYHIKKIISTLEDFEVVGEASNGLRALEELTKIRPDLILTDISMPEMDGIELIKNLKRFGVKAKIVVVSALGQEFKVVEAIEAGATDFVIKPYEMKNLVDKIRAVLAL